MFAVAHFIPILGFILLIVILGFIIKVMAGDRSDKNDGVYAGIAVVIVVIMLFGRGCSCKSSNDGLWQPPPKRYGD